LVHSKTVTPSTRTHTWRKTYYWWVSVEVTSLKLVQYTHLTSHSSWPHWSMIQTTSPHAVVWWPVTQRRLYAQNSSERCTSTH